MENIKEKITEQILNEFCGAMEYHRYRYPFAELLLTDGADYLARNGVGWLIDVIASYQPYLKNQSWQVWYLKLDGKGGANVICTDGNGHELKRQKIKFTDCPIDIRVYLIDGILLLPSEY